LVGIRNYPFVLGAGVAVLLVTLVGAAAVTGMVPSAKHDVDPLQNTAAAAAAKKAACKACGVVASVKAVETTEAAGGAAKHKVYRVTVRMDDGSERVLSLASVPGFGVGSRVRVNGHLLERG
jgi:hypothetical protein